MCTGALYQGTEVKRQDRGADRSSPYDALVKNVWSKGRTRTAAPPPPQLKF
jgi:hypothetical protein